MKKTEIVIIVVAAVVVAIIVAAFNMTNDSVSFAEAKEKFGDKVIIVGTLDKEHEIVYDPNIDANLTRFHVVDNQGVIQEVFLHDDQGQPMGLAQSENVTLTGTFQPDGNFHATHIQMKCPSKYNEQKHSLASDK